MSVQTGKKSLGMRWPSLEAEVVVDLLEDKAPAICEAMWASLPFKSIQGHALITGDMLFATTPVTCLARENVQLFTQMLVGACFFGNSSQNFGVIYGEVTEPEGHSIWGQVRPEHIPILQRVGNATWDNLMLPWSPNGNSPRTKQHIVVEYRPLPS